MEYSRNGTVLMALPLVILILALVIALYQTGFEVEAATLPENPVGPLEETLADLLETDRPLVTGSAVKYDPTTGTIALTGSVTNPTAHPLTVMALEYRVEGDDGEFFASIPTPVIVPPNGEETVVLTGAAPSSVAAGLKSVTAEGMLSVTLEVMGISITSDLARPWKVSA